MADKITTKKVDSYIGSMLPLANSRYGYFNPSVSTVEQIKSNIKNILLTNKGERLHDPHFGCDLRELLFEQIFDYETFTETINQRVRSQIERYMPFIKINNIMTEVEETTDNTMKFEIKISYYFEEVLEDLTFTILGGAA